ncbi:N-formylglutamate deformylase [hydrothermal vent metagenome]|uniref:N-formylglutamate deformylase n=1 Tax=hydrothermal vent metagenome TaxID=652676 RepID=A0A3B0U253_9ZZZZ
MQSDYANMVAFETIRGRRQLAPLVFNSAHSGSDYPKRFLAMTQLDKMSIRQSEDTHVDEIFARVPHMGAILLKANFPRSYLDVNREPYELDPAMFRDPLPKHHNTASPRVAAGLGTLARIVAHNKPIYREALSLADAQMRIEGIYRPYHATLQKLLSETANRFGTAILVDCHSMPALARSKKHMPPDIVLGDRFGTTCSPQLIDMIDNILGGAGLRVARNHPYAGGFITRSYGRPEFGIHAIQIEISRHLYMNEKTRMPHGGFRKIKRIMEQMSDMLIKMDMDQLVEHKYAAE